MSINENPELFWLTATAVLTATLWLPYISCYIRETGMAAAIWDPHGAHPLQAQWAQRAHRAHNNAVENLVIFAPLVLAVHVLGLATELTAAATATYFWARAAHYVIYALGMPILRTVVFAVGWICQLLLALVLFGVM